MAPGQAVILDTCALLFLVSGDARLSAETRALLQAQPQRWFCSISSFEIALQHQHGKLDLPLPPLPWLREVAHRYVLTEIPLDSALCAAAAQLPPHHRDPCDRFIIAAAQRLAAPVVTTDPKFAAYGIEVLS